MINLAGRPNAIQVVTKELIDADITIVLCEKCLKNEVSIPFAGKCGSFWFERAWKYWIVLGKVPLEMAKQLYKNEIGKKDVRVAGNCGCPPPEKWVTWFDDDGCVLIGIISMREIENFRKRNNLSQLQENFRAVPKRDFPKFGKPYVTSYHIDSQEGLNLFIKTLKQFKLN